MTLVRLALATGTIFVSGYLDLFLDKSRLDRSTGMALAWWL